MRLIQAVWNGIDTLLVWGEGAPKMENEISLEHRSHPNALDHAELRALLSTLPLEQLEDGFDTFNLPSLNSRTPLGSPRAQRNQGFESNPIRLLPWQVPTLRIPVLDALFLLIDLPRENLNGAVLDDSFLYWRDISKLLLEILSRGQFVPGMLRERGEWKSRWHIVLSDDAIREKLELLATSMPPVCSALIMENQSANAAKTRSLIQSFLLLGGDFLIRSFLRRNDFLAGVDTSELPQRVRPAEAWIRSLTANNSTLSSTPLEMTSLEQRLRTWNGKILATQEEHELRFCFELHSPPASEIADPHGLWRIDFYLQSEIDPNLTLSAQHVWSGDTDSLEQTRYSADDIEQLFLKELGRALPLFPELEFGLRDPFPLSLSLTTDQAYTFLKQTAKSLSSQGYSVILPAWWKAPSSQVGLHLTINSEAELGATANSGSGLLRTHDLLEFSWNISVAGELLNLEQFRNLVQNGSPLLHVQGQWVELDRETAEKTLSFLEQQQTRPYVPFAEAIRLGLGAGTAEGILPVIGLEVNGWLQQLLSEDRLELSAIKEPASFKGELRPYQRQGLSWLALLSRVGVGGCLADDMGLGKTVQLLALLLHEKELRAQANPPEEHQITLLVVPMSILANWEEELRRFAPELNLYMHHGPTRLQGPAFFAMAKKSDIVLTTYSLAHRDFEYLRRILWYRIALDEAQNIKNLETKQTRAVRLLAEERAKEGGGPTSFHRLALTGTPLENHLEELWSIFDFLNPGLLGTIRSFRETFAIPIERLRDKASAQNLQRIIRPFTLRRLKSDPLIINDLPEKIEMDVYATLSPEQAALYESVLEQMLPQVSRAQGMHRKGLVLATITKLKQICNHPALLLKDKSTLPGRSGKLLMLEDILQTLLQEGDRALLFTQYAQFGALLQPYFQERFGEEVLFFHGALQKGARDKVIQRFKEESGPRVLILSLKAGGFGLNLAEANQVIHIDQWWNPAVQQQATDRAYRIGQKQTVQVRTLICRGTLEEKIHQLLKQKRDLADQIVESTRNLITDLSNDELRELLFLNDRTLGYDEESGARP